MMHKLNNVYANFVINGVYRRNHICAKDFELIRNYYTIQSRSFNRTVNIENYFPGCAL